jgi:predicted negative regulator of RcsB-dependent stress response
MNRTLSNMLTICAAAIAVAPAAGDDLKDLYFGEAVYYAHQGHYFEALERLDAELAQHYGLDEPELDTLHHHIGQAEFSVGDFELNYRMHHRAGRAIRAVLEGDVEDQVRNEAAYRLARIHFQKDQPVDALHALDRISGPVPEAIADDVGFLRANVLLSMGQPTAAVDVLRGLQDSDDLTGFSHYNLGIALYQSGQTDEALRQLDRAGQVKAGDQGTLAIRDKSNLVLGTLLFESADFARSQQSLDRVRLEGPFSNQALLRAGWADASDENYERALVPWTLLVEREKTDAAVQEAMLALPYAYSKMNVYGRAALLYSRAVDTFGAELDKVDASISSIREGRFLEALVREEIRQDKDWVIRLRSLPQTPETYYLMALMASHDFQTALQNYLDLEDLRKKLVAWESSFEAFEDIIRHRRGYYEPLLPDIDTKFRRLDAQIRLRMEQRQHIRERIEHMLIAPRPDLLATSDERFMRARIERIQARLEETGGPEEAGLRERLARLEGILIWNLETSYHARLTEAYKNLRQLNEVVDALQAQYDSFVRARQAAMHSYVGYEIPIRRLRTRVADGLKRVNLLMARQGHMLETVAIRELDLRRERLVHYQNEARYAFADSYDRAARAQGAEVQAKDLQATESDDGEEQG